MRKKLLVMGVVMIALISFSSIASSSVYMQYWDRMNSKGWIYYGNLGIPGYDFYGKYNSVDHVVWKEFDGEIYVPSHENWHVNFDTKCLDGNKPITIVHYNCIWRIDNTPTRYKKFAMGYFHLVDPKASDLEYQGYQWYVYYSGIMPAISKWMDQRGEPPYGPPFYPTIEDTAKLTDWVFENIDFTLIPLIDRIELFDTKGNILTIDISLIK